MSNTIQIKRSSTASSVPTAGQLAQGELAVNLADKAVYTKDNTNAIVKLNAPSIDDKNTGATKHVTIDTSGNVGIGTSSPTGGRLVIAQSNAVQPAIHLPTDESTIQGPNSDTQIRMGGNLVLQGGGVINFGTGGSERMRIDSSGNLLVGYTSSNGNFRLQVNSQIFATSSTIATSDGRYKEDVTPLTGALGLVTALNPVQFKWKEHPVHNFVTDVPTIGFIAQEVEEVLKDTPYINSIIKANECILSPEVKDEEGEVTQEAVTEEFLGIAEGNLIALLTKAIQEQQSMIKDLQTRIEALEGTPEE
jgi:hypothetical protein